jgi:DNA-binding CsgD family transcriptional regulator
MSEALEKMVADRTHELQTIYQVASSASPRLELRLAIQSVQTVSSHLWRMMRKLDVENRTQLALYAVRNKIFEEH